MGGDRVELVEVGAGLGQRLGVLARVAVVDEEVVAHADAEQRAAGVVGLERGEPLAHLGGAVHPEVEDAGGGDQRASSRRGGRASAPNTSPPDVGDPQRGVPQLLELGGGVTSLALLAVAQLTAPDADPTQVHACIRLQVA